MRAIWIPLRLMAHVGRAISPPSCGPLSPYIETVSVPKVHSASGQLEEGTSNPHQRYMVRQPFQISEERPNPPYSENPRHELRKARDRSSDLDTDRQAAELPNTAAAGAPDSDDCQVDCQPGELMPLPSDISGPA